MSAPARRRPTPLEGASASLADLVALRAVRLHTRALRAERGSSGGARLTRLRGRGVDLAEVRLYQPGDDVRSIDWRVTARKGAAHTKVYREERERPTLIAVDQRRTMRFGSRLRLKSVAAAETAALLAWHALDAGDRVGGFVLDDAGIAPVKPLRSPRAVMRLLGRIARSNRALADDAGAPAPAVVRRADLATLLEHAERAATTGYRVYVISDFAGLDAPARRRLNELGRHNSVVAIAVYDVLETELPPPGRYSVADGTARSAFDSDGAGARREYAARFVERRRQIEAACSSAHAELAFLGTHESAAERLTERILG
jgi:uncharacterized protein (DUF58 family)